MPEQKINAIAVSEKERYRVGVGGVDAIKAVNKCGMHCDIPYIQVFKNGELHAEFCQHNITAVYYNVQEVCHEGEN